MPRKLIDAVVLENRLERRSEKSFDERFCGGLDAAIEEIRTMPTMAIGRTVSVPVPNYGLCVKWAFEIQTLCSMLDKIYRMDGKT